MKLLYLVIVAAGLAQAQAPKIALVNIQDVMVGIPEGQDAEKALDDRFGPLKTHIEDEQHQITILQSQLQQEGLTEDARQKLQAQIDRKTLAVNQETDQADADLDQAQKKVLAELGPKVVAAIAAFAKDHGYAMVFDISTSDAPRLYAPNATDITGEVIAALDKRKR
jgi:Skp family chaperone for outer membrane proteins